MKLTLKIKLLPTDEQADLLLQVCKHFGKRTNKHFKCNNCGNDMDADVNASLNIATLGRAVNHVEKSNDMCCSIAHVYSGLKPTPSLCVGG